MRSVLLALLITSTSALAQGVPAPAPDGGVDGGGAAAPAPTRGNGLSLVVVDDLPEACRDLGKLADSPAANQALSARISLAGCLVEQRLKAVVVCDCEQSVHDIESASTQSLALLDEVAVVGEPATRVLALQAKGDLLASFATRIIAAVPPAIDGTESAVTLRDMRLALILPHVGPWHQQARSAYTELDKVARANPQLAKNQVVLAAVRASRTKLSQLDASATAKR